jgi:hypothetical protein
MTTQKTPPRKASRKGATVFRSASTGSYVLQIPKSAKTGTFSSEERRTYTPKIVNRTAEKK